MDQHTRGLSPRVRGNRPSRSPCCTTAGSIPARAGEPSVPITLLHDGGVYPRACGGTGHSLDLNAAAKGLSPRVRGNPPAYCRGDPVQGSIPARAGEPTRPIGKRRAIGVYPRACGGTGRGCHPCRSCQGLSPRVRGNRHEVLVRATDSGSIPARAGEPPSTVVNAPANGVYPRACGGTYGASVDHAPGTGLSPRVRGNLYTPTGGGGGMGSIPARAGEPPYVAVIQFCKEVYPRACGGTMGVAPGAAPIKGLSPRVRGNRMDVGRRHCRCGSIPARAGEPRYGTTGSSSSRVYPRACGGTKREYLLGMEI